MKKRFVVLSTSRISISYSWLSFIIIILFLALNTDTCQPRSAILKFSDAALNWAYAVKDSC